ncbi:MAG TPA: hypothetical protein VIJ69_02430, partial [Actinomycetota bacterium]
MSDAAVQPGPFVVEPVTPGGLDAGVGGAAAELPMMTLWGDVWRRLRRNKLAILGSAIILGLVMTAALAPFIA